MLYHVVMPDDTVTFLDAEERAMWIEGLTHPSTDMADVEWVPCESEVEESVYAKVAAMRDRNVGPTEEGE